MKLELTVKGKIIINVTEKDLKVIAEEHKGNYEEYFEMYPIDTNAIEWDNEDKEYETEDLLTALNKYRCDNGFDENYELPRNLQIIKYLKKYLYMDSLEQLEKYHLKDNLEEFIFDKIELSYISSYADIHHPREELNFVYFDKDSIVSTDSKVLICNKNNSSYNDIYIPKYFCEAYCLFDNARIFFEKKLQLIYLIIDEKVYKVSFENFRYLDYKRIIPNEYKITARTLEVMEQSKTFIVDKEKGVYAFAYRLNDYYLCAKMNINFGLDFIGINSHALPFVLFDERKEKLQIVMPLLLENNEVEEYINKQ